MDFREVDVDPCFRGMRHVDAHPTLCVLSAVACNRKHSRAGHQMLQTDSIEQDGAPSESVAAGQTEAADTSVATPSRQRAFWLHSRLESKQ